VLPLQILGGRYRLDEVLGVGGMSVVWRATDDVLGRSVAVKILAGDYASDPVARAAVLSEAQAVARLSHPNICNVFDYGESLQADGQTVPYVVMELLSGPSLADRLESGPLPAQEALKVAAEVAAGLAAAHAHGIVHRDVKPGNVILTDSGAKVFDFGIAALAGAPDEAGPDGRILATLSCVAPERLQGGVVLPASDMFGWGVLLFRLLTGKLPWPTWAALADRLAATAPLPPIEGVPPKVGVLYLSCLAEDPDDRPTATAAAAVLQVALAVRTPRPREVMPARGLSDDISTSVAIGTAAMAERRRRRRRVVALTAGLIAVLAAGAFAFSKGGQPPAASATSPTTTTSAATGEGNVGEAPPPDATDAPVVLPPPVIDNPFPDGAPTEPVPGVAETPIAPDPSPSSSGPAPTTGPPADRFTTPGGRVVIVCNAYGPTAGRTQVFDDFTMIGPFPLLIKLVVLFYRETPDGWEAWRITAECADGTPQATMAHLSSQNV
jgi:serine/threonine-protein kinase